ncbi:hypothetical protein [Novosphingobium sp.]|uniref:hypothetical protein n=1 Tax=Novosphingobium sp. TaxID=1874826 RepID=UPI003341275F
MLIVHRRRLPRRGIGSFTVSAAGRQIQINLHPVFGQSSIGPVSVSRFLPNWHRYGGGACVWRPIRTNGAWPCDCDCVLVLVTEYLKISKKSSGRKLQKINLIELRKCGIEC